ncbi:MAG TPA: DUF4398 domain-containing protein [Candidatus Binatia bacterium]|jgi:hypothetical protein|nr:DUF4398 domain-containing protein [Candidatus Binatia bacterium]
MRPFSRLKRTVPPLLCGASLVIACGHPATRICSAETRVADADDVDAGHYAPLEMRRAREKLEAARRARDDGDWGEARRLSTEADADAKLAQAKTGAERARATNADLRQATEASGGAACAPSPVGAMRNPSAE